MLDRVPDVDLPDEDLTLLLNEHAAVLNALGDALVAGEDLEPLWSVEAALWWRLEERRLDG